MINASYTILMKKRKLFIYLLILTTVFILAEISFLIECSGLYFGDFKLIANHLKVPLTVIPGIVLFLLTQLLIHFVFTIVVWGTTCLAGNALNWPWKKTD